MRGRAEGRPHPAQAKTPGTPPSIRGPEHHHQPFQVTRMTTLDTTWGGERCPPPPQPMAAPYLAPAPVPIHANSGSQSGKHPWVADPSLGEGHPEPSATYTGLGDVRGRLKGASLLGLPRGRPSCASPRARRSMFWETRLCLCGALMTHVSRYSPTPLGPVPVQSLEVCKSPRWVSWPTGAATPPARGPAVSLSGDRGSARSLSQCCELHRCFLGVDLSRPLLVLVEMCVCASLSGCPQPHLRDPQPSSRRRPEGCPRARLLLAP